MDETPTLWSKADDGDQIVKKEEEEPKWSELPFDLLDGILGNLFAGDRVAFLGVCRSWKSVCVCASVIPRPLAYHHHHHHHHQTLPHLTPYLILPAGNKLFHPMYNASFNFDFDNNIEGSILCDDAVIRVSKYNWLLISQGERGVFFFNPFTKVRVDLPDYKLGGGYGMTFSSPPTSSNCLVAGLTHEPPYIVIYTIRVGQRRWTRRRIRVGHNNNFRLSQHCNPVMHHHKGRLYYLGMLGELFIYDHNKNECSWIKSSSAIQELLSHHPTCERYMMMEDDDNVDGNLLAVFMACDGRWTKVYRLSKKSWEWQAINQLNDKALYISTPGSFCERAPPVRGAGNKVYFPRFRDDGGGLFYSLATNKYHTFSGGSYNNFLNFKKPLSTTWIEPIPTRAVRRREARIKLAKMISES